MQMKTLHLELNNCLLKKLEVMCEGGIYYVGFFFLCVCVCAHNLLSACFLWLVAKPEDQGSYGRLGSSHFKNMPVHE